MHHRSAVLASTAAFLALALAAGTGSGQAPQEKPRVLAPSQPQRSQTPPASIPSWAGGSAPPQQAQAAPTSPVIARVGGRPITQADFDRVANPYFQQLRAQLGPSFAGDVQRMASFNVLDEMVRREVLALEVQRQQVVVTEAEIDALLSQDPFFLTNGVFDPAKLASYKTSPGSNYPVVLPRLREYAAIRKMDESLRKRFTPTQAQVRAEWTQRNDQVRFKMLPLLTRDMSLEGEASEAEWAAYYQAHPDQFMRKTRVRLRLARLPIPVEGDTTRPAAEATAREQAAAIADSLRKGTLADTSSRLTDTGLFDIPAPSVPGVGRLTALTDTLARLDSDSTIRVIGPYSARDAVVVGVVAERQAKHLPPMREVLGDVKRRADADKRRATNEADRRAFYEANREHWRGRRAAVTRITLDPSRNLVDVPQPAEVQRWYTQHGHSLFGLPDTSRAWIPPLGDSLREVSSSRMIAERRAQRSAEQMQKIVAGFRTTRDPRGLARSNGAAAETLTFMTHAGPDTLFPRELVDSLLAAAPAMRGVVQGPRAFGTRWATWRVDATDTAFIVPYEAVRSRSDQEFAEERRQKDEAEARTRFEAHRADYKTPVKYGLEYVAVRPPLPDSVRIPEADIRRAYDRNPKTYTQEEQVKARHILFSTRDASPETDKRLQARADSLLAAIRKEGGDFAELAKRFSQEPGAPTSGGDLGWFGRGRMVKEFETAAFALKPGETSPVVRTQFGYHIIRLEDRKEAGLRPYSEVRGEIRTQMAESRGDSTARRTAESLRRRLAQGGDVKTLAARHGGVIPVAAIGPNDPLPGAGYIQGLGAELPKWKVGKWAPAVQRGNNSYLVMRLREVVPQRPAEFDEVKPQAVEDMKNAKRRALLEQKVAGIRAALASGATLDSVAAPYGGPRDSGFLGQSSAFVPVVGNEPRVVKTAFGMTPGQVSDTLQVAAGVTWLRLEEKKAADPATFKTASVQIEAEMMKKKYDAWFEERKKSVTIEILRADLKGPRPNPLGAVTAGG